MFFQSFSLSFFFHFKFTAAEHEANMGSDVNTEITYVQISHRQQQNKGKLLLWLFFRSCWERENPARGVVLFQSGV